jgi:hypothetical protein
MNQSEQIRRGHSRAEEAKVAVSEFFEQVRQPDMALVLFFCSTAYDLAVVAEEVARHFGDVPVVGCTTAGEIGPAGYQDKSLSGLSFPAGAYRVATGGLDRLQEVDLVEGRAFAQNVLLRLEAHAPESNARNTFGFLLIDGLSRREEPVTHALQDGLGGIRLVGGSAGDDLKFERSWVFYDGAFHTDSAALVLVSTHFPFRILRSQHFVSDGERLVVTGVDAAHRVVYEINGLPAVEEYARLVGVPVASLTPSHFAAFPVVVMIDGTDYVRSIQHINPDGSLTLYCALDEGVVLRVAHGKDLLGHLEATLAELRLELGEIQALLVCDCILRNLEATREGQKAAVGELFRRNNAVGFSTYGEQYCGVHINQTLTGIAIGNGVDTDG